MCLPWVSFRQLCYLYLLCVAVLLKCARAVGYTNVTIEANTCPFQREVQSVIKKFPADNGVIVVDSQGLQELLAKSEDRAPGSELKYVVLLFYSRACPYSSALRPVYHCLPAFFSNRVIFAEMEYSNTTLLTLIAYGFHSLPVVQIMNKGMRYRFSGEHHLAAIVGFLAKSLTIAPEATPPQAATCEKAGTCDWSCPRWDGEASAAEMRQHQSQTILYISVLVLVIRVLMPVASFALKRLSTKPAASPTAPAAIPVGAAGSSSAAAAADASSSNATGSGGPSGGGGGGGVGVGDVAQDVGGSTSTDTGSVVM